MKAQFSIELMLATAGYLALITVMLAAETGIAADSGEHVQRFDAKTRAESACFFIDAFALDGRNTAMAVGAENLSATGEHTLSVSYRTREGTPASVNATCIASIQGSQELRVKQLEREFS